MSANHPCKSCAFYKPVLDNKGECRFSAPQATNGENYLEGGAVPTGTPVWPITSEKMWCGEWIDVGAAELAVDSSTSQRLRTPEAAAYCGLARRTLEKWRFEDKGPPYFNLGRAVIYDTHDLDHWLATGRDR